MHSLEVLAFLLLAFCTVNLTAAQKKKCEKNWLPLDKKSSTVYRCGKHFKERMRHDEAMVYCAENAPGDSGQLVVIPNKYTNTQVEKIIRRGVNGPYIAWIGLKRDEADPGLWRWENDGIMDDFVNWAPDSPNNHQLRGGQNCVFINDYRREGSWNDFECQTLIQFVCQYEV